MRNQLSSFFFVAEMLWGGFFFRVVRNTPAKIKIAATTRMGESESAPTTIAKATAIRGCKYIKTPITEGLNCFSAKMLKRYVSTVVPTTTKPSFQIAENSRVAQLTSENCENPMGRFIKKAIKNRYFIKVMELYFATNGFTKMR